MKKISCIIPVYNSQNYLGRCLDSICNQTYADLEIILIDDGSTDLSGKICDDYKLAYGNVVVEHISNGGASLARKRGLDRANGEYVTFIDSDDYVALDYIEDLYDALKNTNLPITACKVQRVEENVFYQSLKTGYVKRILSKDELMTRFFKYEFWGLYGKLYRKNVFDGIYFPQATLSEDYVVMAQILLKCKQMTYLDKPSYFYEYHKNSLSHQRLSKRAFEEFENVSFVFNLIHEKEIQYSPYALSNVIETATKLLLLKQNDILNEYAPDFNLIRNFIRKHFFQILRCQVVSERTKLLCLGLFTSPKIVSKIINKIKFK